MPSAPSFSPSMTSTSNSPAITSSSHTMAEDSSIEGHQYVKIHSNSAFHFTSAYTYDNPLFTPTSAGPSSPPADSSHGDHISASREEGPAAEQHIATGTHQIPPVLSIEEGNARAPAAAQAGSNPAMTGREAWDKVPRDGIARAPAAALADAGAVDMFALGCFISFYLDLRAMDTLLDKTAAIKGGQKLVDRGAQAPGYNLGSAAIPDARAGYRPVLTGKASAFLLLKQPLTTLMHGWMDGATWIVLTYGMHSKHVPYLHVFDIRSLGTT